ncbi:MAG: PDZ domain-containing protein [Magnetococcus sp. YQC-5]
MSRAASWVVSWMFLGVIALVITALFFSQDPGVGGTVARKGGGSVPVAVPVAWNKASVVSAQPPASYVAPKMKLSEGHWQGMDAMDLSVELKTKLRLPMTLEGVLLGETTLAAARSGLLAGDVLVAVERMPVGTLEALHQASRQVAHRSEVQLTAWRKGRWMHFVMRAPDGVLGFAQMETAPMIRASDLRPHAYRGACTECHAIGTTGHITPDPDSILLPAPVIRAGAVRPHQDRGPCQACHAIRP